MNASDNELVAEILPLRPRTVLHLGMPKTATTMLQRCLFARHSQVEYLGKFAESDKYRCPELARFLDHFVEPHKPMPAGVIEHLQHQMQVRWQAGKTCVFSKEGLTAGGKDKKRRQAELFRHTFGDCRILLTIREPLSFIEALYFQQLKGFNKKRGSHEFLLRALGSPPRYFDINRWLSILWALPYRRGFDHVNIGDTAEIYANVFGRENVDVVIFEKLKRNSSEFLEDVSRCVGISLDESIQLCEGQARNLRWTEAAVDRLKRLEKSFFTRWKYQFNGGKRELYELLGINEEAHHPSSPKARANLAPEWRARIEEIGREQSQKLLTQWNLPLAEYGYPLPETQQDARRAA